MKERPILFSGPMVGAILEGRKTVTRRLWPSKIEAGDRLWVRETWHKGFMMFNGNIISQGQVISYKADNENLLVWKKWRPSIHMPRWASRITLEVLSVRKERLQEVTEEDAIKEGIERLKSGRGFYDPTTSKSVVHLGHYFSTARQAFQCVWDSLNAKRGQGWEANPEVARIEFKVLEGK